MTWVDPDEFATLVEAEAEVARLRQGWSADMQRISAAYSALAEVLGPAAHGMQIDEGIRAIVALFTAQKGPMKS